MAKALVGWKRDRSTYGIILTLQLAGSVDDFQRKSFDEVSVALNQRQLRSLARDLTRAAARRGIEVFATPAPWWKFWA